MHGVTMKFSVFSSLGFPCIPAKSQ